MPAANECLLISVNIIAGLILANIAGINGRVKEVEKKVDHHICDYSIHRTTKASA